MFLWNSLAFSMIQWMLAIWSLVPSEQDPVSPTVSLSHQEASISLLSFSIREQTDWNHNHRKLTNLVTWTTAWSNSMKLWAMECKATKDRCVMVESSDSPPCGPLEKGMANHFSILALRTPWTVWKGKKTGHWKMNSPGWWVPNMLLAISGEMTSERMKRWSQSKDNTQLWMWLVMEARSDAVKSNTA